MDYHLTSSFFIQALPCLFAFTLIYILWSRRHVDGVIYLILTECAASIWAITDALEHAAATLPLKVFWSQMGNFGSSTTAVFLLLFVLSFTQNQKLINWKFIFFVFTIPAITIVLAFTNSSHHLIWESVDFFPLTNDSVYHYGKWFWIFIAYEFSLVGISIIILLNSTLQFYKIYKFQVFFLILASILPLIASVIYVFKLSPLKADLTPISLIFSGICVAMGVFYEGMFDIMPIARKQIIENFNDSIIVIDGANRIIDVNSSLIALTGVPSEKLIGNNFKIVSNRLFEHQIDFEKTTASTVETVIRVANEKRYFEVTYTPVYLSNNKLIGKIFIFHDITRRKKALDTAVESNRLLREEIKEKEKLILDLDAYARSVAHDLKNPISGLLGLRDILREDIINNNQEQVFELLDMVHDQGLKMYKIVDELLLLSRIRKEDIKTVPIDMAFIIDEAVKRLQGVYKGNKVSIETPPSWPQILGHPQWIEEVWFNFISNALKYGGNPPFIKVGYEKADNSTIRFWIQDNGDGLPPDSLARLFNDFERLERENIEGHGLGLSIIKRIIEKLGGEVLVTSENAPGKGCIFSFTLKAGIEESEYRDHSLPGIKKVGRLPVIESLST